MSKRTEPLTPSSRSRRKAAVLFVLAVTLAAAALIARPHIATLFAAQSPGDNGPGILLIYVTPHGFQQPVVNVPRGVYHVLIRNRSGMDGLTFTMSNGHNEVVLQGSANAGQNVVQRVFPFQNIEEYVVREASHPDWQCRLIVQP